MKYIKMQLAFLNGFFSIKMKCMYKKNNYLHYLKNYFINLILLNSLYS